MNLASNTLGAAGGANTLTIYMNFLPNNSPVTSGYTGYAPQLYCASGCFQTSYAQYDTGATVFNFYDNFAGTKLNTALWSPISNTIDAYYTINNGITFTITSASNSIALYSLNTYNPANYIEEQGINSLNIPVTDAEYTADWFIVKPSSIGGFTEDYRFELINSGSGLQYRMCADPTGCGAMLGSGISNSNIFGALWQSTGNEYIYQNYIQKYSYGNSYYSITPSYIATQFNTYTYSGTITGTLNFIRLREYPPNGVMPSASFGSIV